MSAPPGFNPNASLLPDPGPSAAPIQVMRGGGNKASSASQKGGAFSPAELAQLAKYQLGPGGVIAGEFDDAFKAEFLRQVADKSRCRRTTGNSIILGKGCDTIVKVIRTLLKAKITSGNRQAPPSLKPSVGTSTGTGEPLANEEASINGESNNGSSTRTPFTNDESNNGISITSETSEGFPEFENENEESPGGAAAGPPGQPPVTPAKPATPGADSRELTKEVINAVPNGIPKPSPCKNRGTRKQNNGASNSGSEGSVNEESRVHLNVPGGAGAGAFAAPAAAAGPPGGNEEDIDRDTLSGLPNRLVQPPAKPTGTIHTSREIAEELNSGSKPSPCKNRGTRKQNNGASNSGSEGSVNEESRAHLNVPGGAGAGTGAAPAAAAPVPELTRQNANRSLPSGQTRKKKRATFLTTEGSKRPNEERLPGELNIAFTESIVPTEANNKTLRGARTYYINRPEKFVSTAASTLITEAKRLATANTRQIKNVDLVIKQKKAAAETNGKSEEKAKRRANNLANKAAKGELNNSEVSPENA